MWVPCGADLSCRSDTELPKKTRSRFAIVTVEGDDRFPLPQENRLHDADSGPQSPFFRLSIMRMFLFVLGLVLTGGVLAAEQECDASGVCTNAKVECRDSKPECEAWASQGTCDFLRHSLCSRSLARSLVH
jgi:hypothetical protein